MAANQKRMTFELKESDLNDPGTAGKRPSFDMDISDVPVDAPSSNDKNHGNRRNNNAPVRKTCAICQCPVDDFNEAYICRNCSTAIHYDCLKNASFKIETCPNEQCKQKINYP